MSVVPPPEQNATADALISGANSAGVKFIEALIIADFPWMGFPLIRLFLGWGLAFVAGYVTKAEETEVSFLVIDSQTSSEETALSAALKALAVAQKAGNSNEVQKAIQAYADAQSALIKKD